MARGPDFIVTGTRGAGKAPVGDPPEWTDVATQSELDTHVAAADPHTGYQRESEKAAASGYAGLDGNVFVPSAQLARYRAVAVAVGPSSAAEVTLINQTVPAGLMGTTGILRCSIGGDWLNNDATTDRTFTVRVYAGGTKIYDGVTDTLARSVNRRAFGADLRFANRNAAGSNQLFGQVSLGNQTAPTTGISSPGRAAVNTSFLPQEIASDQVAIDTSVDWIFKVTLQLSASVSTLDMRISSVLLEVV